MFDLTKAAYDHGEYAALGAYGLTKEAVNWGALAGRAAKWGGNAMKWLGRAAGVVPVVGTLPGMALAAGGSAIGSIASGENFQTGAARALGAAGTAAIPGGAGLFAGAAVDEGMDRLSKSKPAPTGITNYNRGAKGPAVGPMPGHVGEQHGLPGGAA